MRNIPKNARNNSRHGMRTGSVSFSSRSVSALLCGLTHDSITDAISIKPYSLNSMFIISRMIFIICLAVRARRRPPELAPGRHPVGAHC
jgi:hypothetical protein